MTKEHKKMYKAGKNWIVATLTVITITLLGGIGAYTVHADTTAENNQSTETSNISQSSQSDNSSNSVVLTQPMTTQSNQTALSNQSEQSTPTNQVTSTAATNITMTNSFNKVTPNNYGAVNENSNSLLTQKYSDNSSLWYHPSVDYHFDNEIAKSGTGDSTTIAVQDPYQPSITTYYSFTNFSDNPEISQYAHTEVTRDIYIKDPQTGVESFDRHDLVIFNRWVAVDTTRNNQLVGLGPWVLSLTSPKSFPKYNIPQKNGYTSYCNGKKATMIDEEQVSGNQPDEIYHITYVPTSSLVDKKTRTIIINYPNGEQKSTFVQNAELDGSTYSWPEYIIPGEVGYDSYVDGHKATSIPTQTVHVYDNDNVIVNVTYRRPVSDPTHKTITRTICIHDIDGNASTIQQAVVYIRYAICDIQGNIESYTNWVADGNSSWNEYAIPQHEGFISQIGSEDTKVVPSQLVNPNDEDTIVNVTYKKTPVKHKAITRTIKITYPSGYVQTISQTVNYTYHTVKIGSEVLAGWVADGNDSWDEYAIPQHDGFISQVDSQDAKIVPSQHVNPNDKDVDVSITYIKTDSSKGNGNVDDNNNPSRLNTGTINYIDPDGKVVKTDQISGKVGDKVDVKISLPDGYELANKDEQVPSTITVGDDGIKTIIINIKKIPESQTGNTRTGFLNLNGHTYYFGDDGIRWENRWMNAWGNKYYFKSDGARATNEMVNIDGATYYFDGQGIMKTNYFLNQKGNTYYFGQDGARWENRWMNIWGHRYYFKADGSRATSEITKIGKDYYYFDGQGIMKTNYFLNQKGKIYYFGNDGKEYRDRFYTNWGHTYYFGTDGARWDNRWMNAWGNKYYFKSDGARATNEMVNIDGATYYFDGQGIMKTNYFLNQKGNTYYFGQDGARWENRWMNIWGHRYYFKADGSRATSEITKVGKDYYYFDNQGIMKTNYFLNQKGKVYYFGNDGKEYRDRFYTNWGHTYYFGTDGARYTNQWSPDKKYYFGSDGAALTGQHKLAGVAYVFGADGHVKMASPVAQTNSVSVVSDK